MPKGIYIRTEENKKNISKGHKGKRWKKRGDVWSKKDEIIKMYTSDRLSPRTKFLSAKF